MNESFENTATKHGLTPERLDQVSAEIHGILAGYELNEILAVAELLENGTPSRMNGRDKGTGRL